MLSVIRRLAVPRLAAALALALCLLAGRAVAADTKPVAGPPSVVVHSANELIEAKKYQEAIALLEPWVKEHPEDEVAAQTLLSARVTLKEQEIRKLLAEQALTKGMIVGDPDYEFAKARSEQEVRVRLDVVEYYVAQKQYGDAAALCNAILHDYPHNEAALCLKFRILETLVAREREALLKDQRYRHGEGVNDVIRDGTFPRDPPKVPRTVWIFDEDIEAAERAQVEQKLQQKVTLIYDGSMGTQSAQVREVLGPLFAYIGINYVILDDALGNEKLTIHLVDEPVGDALATIAKMVKVRFNYSGGTVFVTNTDSEVMITRIIHLRSGLTDVETDAQMAQFSNVNGQNGQNGQNGGPGQNGLPNINGLTPQQQQQMNQLAQGQQQGQQGQQQQQKSKSDLEKFLDKIPDIIVGWPGEAKMYLDRKSNTLYVRSTPSTIDELQRLLDALDYNNVQVLIETRFIEVTEDAARELGVDWSGGGQKGSVAIGGADLVGPGGAPNPAASGATIGTTAAALAGSTPPNNGLFAQVLLNRGLNIAAKISALEQEGKADTLSEPKILALNNSLGVIEVKQNVPYVSTYNSSTTSQTSQVNNGVVIPTSTTALVPDIQNVDTGITLRIRPSIARNSDVITLSIAPLVTELIKKDTFPFQYPAGTGNNGVINAVVERPEVGTRSLTSTLHVQNGQTIALGGLTREREERNMAGVPFFSRIPLIGHLFRRDSRSSDRRNLVILVTAHLVEPNGSKDSDEVQRLRDTAKVVLPEATIEAEQRAAGANPNGQQPQQVPAEPRPSQQTPWQKGK